MKTVVASLRLLILCLFIFQPCYAGPLAGSPEGAFRVNQNQYQSQSQSQTQSQYQSQSNSSVPFGCEIMGTRYVDSNKCAGGRCLVQEIDCCGNNKVDNTHYDAVTGLPISSAETCDGQPFCRASCNYCGDGIVQASEGEQCDLGKGGNGRPNSGCSATCTNTGICGDAVKTGYEQCDAGVNNGRPLASFLVGLTRYFCSSNCGRTRIPYCGDGIKDPNEQCDTGNGLGNPNRTYRVGSKEYYCLNNCTPKETERECLWIAQTGMSSPGIVDNYRQALANNVIDRFESVPSCFMRLRAKCLTGGFSMLDMDHARTWGGCSSGIDDFHRILGTSLSGKRGATLRAWRGYMDSNCREVHSQAGYDICGYVGVAVSPVSLIMEENYELDADTRVVEFSLGADERLPYSVWKASDKAPLLVFDPKKTGKVESAEQLFGNWTFGGKNAKGVQLTSQKSGSSPEAWTNGYEALGSLDLDRNGKVEGAELNSLSLWFDENRDAVVDRGELRPVKEEGIVSLYYNKVKSVSGSQDLEVELGYERLVDGKLVSGRSVDWYGYGFSSKDEALDALSGNLLGTSGDALTQLPVSSSLMTPAFVTEQELSEFSPHVPTDLSKDVSGYWMWHVNGEESSPNMLMLEQSQDGSVKGYSFVEMRLAENAAGAAFGIKAYRVSGRAERGKSGVELKLVVEDPETGMRSESRAEVHPGGRMLKAKSTQRYAENSQAGAKSVALEYEWTAGRL